MDAICFFKKCLQEWYCNGKNISYIDTKRLFLWAMVDDVITMAVQKPETFLLKGQQGLVKVCNAFHGLSESYRLIKIKIRQRNFCPFRM